VLRQDNVARRGERVVTNRIEAYCDLENAAARKTLTEEQKSLVERYIGAPFLLGSKGAAKEANALAEKIAIGYPGDMNQLLRQMRSDLRQELGLEQHHVAPLFVRFLRDQSKRK
jgi:hypothetical protein